MADRDYRIDLGALPRLCPSRRGDVGHGGEGRDGGRVALRERLGRVGRCVSTFPPSGFISEKKSSFRKDTPRVLSVESRDQLATRFDRIKAGSLVRKSSSALLLSSRRRVDDPDRRALMIPRLRDWKPRDEGNVEWGRGGGRRRRGRKGGKPVALPKRIATIKRAIIRPPSRPKTPRRLPLI